MPNKPSIFTKEYKNTKNFLHYRQHHSLNACNRIIKRYGVIHDIIIPLIGDDVSEFYKYMHQICVIIQADWESFSIWYKSIKSEYTLHYKKKNEYVYSEWSDIQEALQYTNGCADDF